MWVAQPRPLLTTPMRTAWKNWYYTLYENISAVTQSSTLGFLMFLYRTLNVFLFLKKCVTIFSDINCAYIKLYFTGICEKTSLVYWNSQSDRPRQQKTGFCLFLQIAKFVSVAKSCLGYGIQSSLKGGRVKVYTENTVFKHMGKTCWLSFKCGFN